MARVNNPCYDKVKFYLDIEAVGKDVFRSLCDRLNQISKDGRCYIGSVFFKQHERSISGCGSFSKFINGSSLLSISLDETEAVINALSDALGVDLSSARVTQLEFGATYKLQNPIADYLDILGAAPYTKRIETSGGETISYTPRSRAKSGKGRDLRPAYSHTFYNKGAEMGLDERYLRYELKFNRELSRKLKMKGGVTLKTLCDSQFYGYMCRLYSDFYNSIKKRKEMKLAKENIKTVGDGSDALFAELLNESAPDRIEKHIARMKREDTYKDQTYYSKLKSKLNGIAQRRDITTSSELTLELDGAIAKSCTLT